MGHNRRKYSGTHPGSALRKKVPAPTERNGPTTMRFLSLCADSARPPGLTTHHKPTMTTTINSTSVRRQCEMSLTSFSSNAEKYLPTAYYKNTTPPPCITPHSPMKKRTSKCLNNNTNHGQQTEQVYADIPTTPPLPTHQSVPLSYNTPHTPMASLHDISDLPTLTLSWQILFLVIFTIATVLPLKLKKKRAKKRINTFCTPKRRRNKYPMAKPPGTRPKTGKNNTTWNMVYDPARDQVLEWSSNRVRIYQRSNRGHRLFTYHKGKHEKTFPRQALPISGTWNGSHFIVNHVSHWMDSPTSAHCDTPASRAKRNIKQNQMENQTETATRPPSKTWRPKTDRLRKQKSPQRKNKKVSRKSNPKWQTQVRQFITNWTSPQMDAYLAIPEVALDWNVEPG